MVALRYPSHRRLRENGAGGGGHHEMYLNSVLTVFLRQAEGLAEHYVKSGTDFAFSNDSKGYKYPKAATMQACTLKPVFLPSFSKRSEAGCGLLGILPAGEGVWFFQHS